LGARLCYFDWAGGPLPIGETRKLAAILTADVVEYSRLAGADEEDVVARLRALHSDLIDRVIAAHRGRVVKRTGDGARIALRRPRCETRGLSFGSICVSRSAIVTSKTCSLSGGWMFPRKRCGDES
jgi:class 3 adenylate cyclase